MQPFPNQIQEFVDGARRITKAFSRYLQQFTQAPPNLSNLSVTVSPYSYTAKEPGYLIVTGGVVSAVHWIRGLDNIDLTGQKIIPVSINDTVVTTYSGLPTIRFVPIYGAAAA